MQVLTKPSFLK